MTKIKDYLASIGKRGGEAGTGKAKARDPEHYRKMAAKSAKVRRAKRLKRPANSQGSRRAARSRSSRKLGRCAQMITETVGDAL